MDDDLNIMEVLEIPALKLLEMFKEEKGVGVNTPLTREELREFFACLSAIVDEHEATLE